MEQPPRPAGGAYAREYVLGVGSHGFVWRARDTATGRPVALKRAAAGEVAALTAVSHPHIVRVAGCSPDGLATEVATGGSVGDLLAGGGVLRLGEVVGVVEPVARALAVLHAAGVVHGDVSPANILLTGDGTPLLADFGSARSVHRSARDRVTATPGFVAPEIVAGGVPTPGSDVFALATVATRLLGDAGWRGAPAGLRAALAGALEARPASRVSAGALADALASAGPAEPITPSGPPGRALVGSETVTRPFGPRPPRLAAGATAGCRSSRLPASLGALVAVAVLAAGWALGARTVAWPPSRCVVDPVRPDVDGDGCADPVSVRDGVVWVPAGVLGGPEASFEVGMPGDVVTLGDWDCDGSDTPGVYRPATGAIALFTGWPAPRTTAPPAVRSTGRAGGTVTVVRHGRCDELVVS